MRQVDSGHSRVAFKHLSPCDSTDNESAACQIARAIQPPGSASGVIEIAARLFEDAPPQWNLAADTRKESTAAGVSEHALEDTQPICTDFFNNGSCSARWLSRVPVCGKRFDLSINAVCFSSPLWTRMWATVDQLLADIETGKSFRWEERPPRDREVGVVKISAVTSGEYDEEKSKTCLDDSMIRPELFIQAGTAWVQA